MIEKHIEVDASKWATSPLDDKVLGALQPTNGWISVKDHLPKNNQKVLFQGINGGMYIGCYQGDKIVDFVYFRTWKEDSGYIPVKCIAWQPLPLPYKGE